MCSERRDNVLGIFFFFYLKTRFTRMFVRFVLPVDLVLWNEEHVDDRTYEDNVKKTITSHIHDAGETSGQRRFGHVYRCKRVLGKDVVEETPRQNTAVWQRRRGDCDRGNNF